MQKVLTRPALAVTICETRIGRVECPVDPQGIRDMPLPNFSGLAIARLLVVPVAILTSWRSLFPEVELKFRFLRKDKTRKTAPNSRGRPQHTIDSPMTRKWASIYRGPNKWPGGLS